MSDKKPDKLKNYDFGTYVVTNFEIVLQNYSTSLDSVGLSSFEVYAMIPMSSNGGGAPGGDNSNESTMNDN